MWTTFGKVSTLADFRTVGASTLNRTLRNFLWNISKNNILEFGIYWRGQCAICTNFCNHNFSGRFLNSSCKPFAQGRWISFWNIPKNDILEFGAYQYGINPGSVLGGQFLGNAICWLILEEFMVAL